MRLVVQRVKEASVTISGDVTGKIACGLVVLIGIETEDRADDIDWLVSKLVNMRIFSDEAGRMNLSLTDVAGELLVISQFTLFASTKKGNRPGFTRSAHPEFAIPLYEAFVAASRNHASVATGRFGADMQVSLVNEGPVTIIIDSKNRE